MDTFISILAEAKAADGIGGVVANLFYALFYRICSGLCWIIGILNQLFSVMSGMTKVRYDGKASTLMDVFFGNTVVEKVYWAMALIGILLCFVFAIIAVARKAVDSGEKMRQSMGGILTALFKGILIIISLTFVLNIVLTLSDKVFVQINYAFNNADTLGEEDTIEFTDDQFAAMARVLDTVANYSLNPSYNSRYNLNSCYNEIRSDLQYLAQQGVFDFYYVTEEGEGESWQSALQKIVNAADLSADPSFDVYNTALANALLDCMETMQTDYSFAPLRTYTRQYSGTNTTVPLDRLIFLMATTRAASNSIYNENVSTSDPLRGAYYTGEKSIYDYTQVTSDFNMGSIDYILMLAVAFKLIWDLAVIILDCVARIFNMVFLYLVAPPFIGVMPLDEGGKFKQWMIAFVVQSFGVFGTVIAMRVMLLFIPIIVDSDLVLFESDVLNLIGKVVLILGGMSVAKHASGVITGILADSAGFQAISASNIGERFRTTMDHLRNRVTGYGEVGGMRANGLGLRSLFDSKGEKKQGGDTPSKASGSGSADTGPTDPEPPEVPPMPEGDWREQTRQTEPIPEAPPMPEWNEGADRWAPPAPEVPPMPAGDWQEQTRQTEPIPEAPPVPSYDRKSGRQVAPVPEAPPMPEWNDVANAQVPQAPPMPEWNQESHAQVPKAPPMPSWNAAAGAQMPQQAAPQQVQAAPQQAAPQQVPQAAPQQATQQQAQAAQQQAQAAAQQQAPQPVPQQAVPEAPPMPEWNGVAHAQVPQAPPMPSWNAAAGAQMPPQAAPQQVPQPAQQPAPQQVPQPAQQAMPQQPVPPQAVPPQQPPQQ